VPSPPSKYPAVVRIVVCLDCGAMVLVSDPPGSKTTVILTGTAAQAKGLVVEEEPATGRVREFSSADSGWLNQDDR
jgi:hypothetical protein